VLAKTPPHRLDIGEGIIGQADLLEEVARMYGYDNIPGTRLADELPKQRGNPLLEAEEAARYPGGSGPAGSEFLPHGHSRA
jgi:phenylalanyl-tRNA synthetase beta chain